jgi:hypothetical protein
MYFIFGSYGRDHVTSHHGQFWCPNCQVNSTYAEVRQRRYAHLFFVPLLRIGEEPNGIRCTGCLGRFDEDALNFRPADQSATWNCPQCMRVYRDALIRCPVCKIRPDGTPA